MWQKFIKNVKDLKVNDIINLLTSTNDDKRTVVTIYNQVEFSDDDASEKNEKTKAEYENIIEEISSDEDKMNNQTKFNDASEENEKTKTEDENIKEEEEKNIESGVKEKKEEEEEKKISKNNNSGTLLAFDKKKLESLIPGSKNSNKFEIAIFRMVGITPPKEVTYQYAIFDNGLAIKCTNLPGIMKDNLIKQLKDKYDIQCVETDILWTQYSMGKTKALSFGEDTHKVLPALEQFLAEEKLALEKFLAEEKLKTFDEGKLESLIPGSEHSNEFEIAIFRMVGINPSKDVTYEYAIFDNGLAIKCTNLPPIMKDNLIKQLKNKYDIQCVEIEIKWTRTSPWKIKALSFGKDTHKILPALEKFLAEEKLKNEKSLNNINASSYSNLTFISSNTNEEKNTSETNQIDESKLKTNLN